MVDTARKIAELIAAQTDHDPSEITAETRLDELNMNSLELLEVIMSIEDEFGVSVDMDAAEAVRNVKTVGDLVTFGETLGIKS